jgi:hypothetical protein
VSKHVASCCCRAASGFAVVGVEVGDLFVVLRSHLNARAWEEVVEG